MNNWWKGFVAIMALIALGIIVFEYWPGPKPKGCYNFDDGTVQGWTLNQLYDTDDATIKLQSGKPSTPASPGWFTSTPFTLKNSQNLALEANTPMVVITDPNAPQVDIYFESPDLSNNSDWQQITGYSFDVHRKYRALGDPPNIHFVQFQLMVDDNSTKEEKLIAETDASGKFKFHEIVFDTPYYLAWQGADFSKYTIKQVRIRSTMLGYTGKIEDAPRGSWLIGNVCPVQ